MRYLGLILSALALFLALLPAASIMEIEDPRRSVMTLFYLSIVLALFLSFVFSAAGRAQGLAMEATREGLARQLQGWGFPVLYRHGWGDFGRLYALLFLVFMAPILLALFVTLTSTAFVGFEQRVDIQDENALQTPDALTEEERERMLQLPTETEAIRDVASGDITLEAAEQERADLILLIAQIAAGVGYILIFPCFARLVPFYFWRSGGPKAATLAETWRSVSWRRAFIFGLSLLLGLLVLFFLPTPLWVRYALAAAFFAGWALVFARQTGPYVSKTAEAFQ